MARLSIAIALLCAFAVFSAVSAQDSDVVVLTADNFDQVLKENNDVFIKFYAPWCGHCKSMAEDWKKAATTMKGKAVYAEVDCTVEKDIAARYKVTGYPSLKLFRNGAHSADYKGGRDLASLVKYIEKAQLPAAAVVESAEQAQQFISDNAGKNVVVGFYPTSATQQSVFEGVAREVQEDAGKIEVRFAVAKSADAWSAFGGASDANEAAVILRNTNGDVKQIPAGKLSTQLLTALAPAVGSFGADTAGLYQKLNLPLLIAFTKDSGFPAALEAVAEEARGVVAPVTVDIGKYARFAEHVGLGNGPFPAYAIHKMNDDQTFTLPVAGEAATEEAVRNFLNQFKNGELKVTLKSDPIPETNDEPVKIVVGDSWESIVMDSGKDVLIEQYAPWCGHCKKLEPIYTDLATQLSSIPSITIAKMDATKNDAPSPYKAKSFPTIYFFPAGDAKKGVQYSGPREAADFIKFLKENAAIKFELPTASADADDHAGHDHEL